MLQTLKSLVIIMGILILVGMAALGYGFYRKFHHATIGGTSSVAAKRPGFGQKNLPIPRGCQIVDMKPDGKKLYVRLGPESSCAEILVIDSDNGTVLGTLKAMP